jgi:hypothetical protein
MTTRSDTRLANSTEHHTTTDLSCAAFLMARGHPLLRTERQPNGRCVYVPRDGPRRCPRLLRRRPGGCSRVRQRAP